MAQFYVSPTGVDTANGLSTAAPVKTISKAIDLAKTSGDVINLMAGDYITATDLVPGQQPVQRGSPKV